MKKTIACLLTILTLLAMLSVSAMAADITASGTCGENVTWTLDSDGVLTISGTGPMEDYSAPGYVPWYSSRYSVSRVVIENGVTSIGCNAFYECQNSLTSVTIPASVTSIGKNAFYKCWRLTDITVPASVTRIDTGAFSWCLDLTGIWVDEANLYYSSDERGVLFNKDKTDLIQAPGALSGSYTIADCVTEIADAAFKNCKSVTKIMVGNGVTDIGEAVFSGCTSLTGVTLPNGLTSIGSDAFYGCYNMPDITIPEGVISIGSFAFADCGAFTSITLPDSVTTLGDNAFFCCDGLTDIVLSESLTTIGTYAFEGSILTGITIPASVTEIGQGAFRYCSTLSEITFCGGAPTIGSNAFYSTEVTAYYPAGNPTWTADAMQNYGGTITWVAVGGESEPVKPEIVASGSCGENVTWTLDSDGVLTISGTGEMVTSVMSQWYDYNALITKAVIGDGITSIGEFAFQDCAALTDVEIPDSVTAIGDLAFWNCTALTDVKLPDSITSIGAQAFDGCTALTEIAIPGSVTSVGQSAFKDCTALSAVTIPASLESMGNGVFSSCEALMRIDVDAENPVYCSVDGVVYSKDMTELKCQTDARTGMIIPDGVTVIGKSAFAGCAELTEVTIPNSVTSIGAYAFDHCISLTNVVIPDSVTEIGDYAFSYCYVLRSVRISANITVAGESVFAYSPRLDVIVFAGMAPEIGEKAFFNVTALAWYPSSEAGWTEDVMQDYGGTIRWMSYSQGLEVPALVPSYPTLSFEDEVYYNIYFTLFNDEDVVELGMVTFDFEAVDGTVDNAALVIPGAVYESESDLYSVRTGGIPAKKLGDTVWFKIYAKMPDGSYVYSDIYEYSALEYANDRLAYSNDEELKSLCVAMLNYGAAAQVQFNYNTDNLMNAGLTDEQKAMVRDYDSTMVEDVVSVDSAKAGQFAYNSAGFVSRYPSVSFEGSFAINYFFDPALAVDGDMALYYWDLDTYYSVDVLTAENAAGTITMTAMDGGIYTGTVGDIAAKEIDDTIFVAGVYESNGVTYSTGVLPYSLGAYCVDRIENGSETMSAFAKATAVYGYYADQYFF